MNHQRVIARGSVLSALAYSLICMSVASAQTEPADDGGFDEGGWDETTAEIITYGMPVAALGIAQLKGDKEGRNEWFWTLVATNTLQGAVKLAFKDSEWGKRPGSTNRYSFPSGHTANGVAISEFLLERYGWRYGIPAYFGTGFVVWERLNDQKHNERDIYAGAAIGFIVATWITEEYIPKGKNAPLAVVPVVDAENVGLLLHYRLWQAR